MPHTQPNTAQAFNELAHDLRISPAQLMSAVKANPAVFKTVRLAGLLNHASRAKQDAYCAKKHSPPPTTTRVSCHMHPSHHNNQKQPRL
jgi:hypothetical protein